MSLGPNTHIRQSQTTAEPDWLRYCIMLLRSRGDDADDVMYKLIFLMMPFGITSTNGTVTGLRPDIPDLFSS